jgi:hypothetical protein
MAATHDECLDGALRRLRRLRRELACDPDQDELFLAAFGFRVCEWCGHEVDKRYGDCALIFNPRDPTGQGELVCLECATTLRLAVGAVAATPRSATTTARLVDTAENRPLTATTNIGSDVPN